MENKNSETQEDINVPSKAPVLRASSFKSSSSNSSCFAPIAPNPFSLLATNGDKKAGSSNKNDEDNNKTSTGSSKAFFLRPSPLQHHVNLIKETPTPASTTLNSFKLDPPKLLCPITENKTFPKDSGPGRQEEGLHESHVTSIEKAPCNGDTKENKSDDNKDNLTQNTETITSITHSTTTATTSDAATTSLTAAATTSSAASTSKAGVNPASRPAFVFGSNLADRVLNGGNQDGEDEDEPSTFETATSSSNTTAPPSLSLAESAAKHQNKDLKPELKEVKVETGEEGEENVLQIFAKLHLFNKVNQTWMERGRGWLRLNDMPGNTSLQSRLVMRAQGTQRVILNMKLWQGMLVDRVSSKNVKLSMIDAVEGLLVYLVTASINDTEQMFDAIKCRSKRMDEAGKKRTHENTFTSVNKKPRTEGTGDDSNDNSLSYPETETSNEGFTSSPAVQSSSPSSEA